MVGQLRSKLRDRLWQIGFHGDVKICGITTVTMFFWLQMVIHWDGTEWKFYTGLLSCSKEDGESYFRISNVLWQEYSAKWALLCDK